jgi:hypothetical protein|tara:strand:+ start:73 stop:2205 length:2133 start_codon:yes stop_codon:yes gene_type:complete
MSVLNRKLFNRGGRVSSRGVGITSGLTTPKRGYVDRPGSYQGKEDAESSLPVPKQFTARPFEDIFAEKQGILENLRPPTQEFSKFDAAAPALMTFFGNLMSGKSFNTGVGGAFDIAGQALQQATPEFSQALRARREAEAADRKEKFALDLQAYESAEAAHTAELVREAKAAEVNYDMKTFNYTDDKGRLMKEERETLDGVTWTPVAGSQRPATADKHVAGSTGTYTDDAGNSFEGYKIIEDGVREVIIDSSTNEPYSGTGVKKQPNYQLGESLYYVLNADGDYTGLQLDLSTPDGRDNFNKILQQDPEDTIKISGEDVSVKDLLFTKEDPKFETKPEIGERIFTVYDANGRATGEQLDLSNEQDMEKYNKLLADPKFTVAKISINAADSNTLASNVSKTYNTDLKVNMDSAVTFVEELLPAYNATTKPDFIAKDTIVGTAFSVINNLKSNIDNLAKLYIDKPEENNFLFVGEDGEGLKVTADQFLETFRLKNDANRSLVEEVAAGGELFNSRVIGLAYTLALQNNPDGRISEPDFRYALQQLKGGSADPKIIGDVMLLQYGKSKNKYILNWMNQARVDDPDAPLVYEDGSTLRDKAEEEFFVRSPAANQFEKIIKAKDEKNKTNDYSIVEGEQVKYPLPQFFANPDFPDDPPLKLIEDGQPAMIIIKQYLNGPSPIAGLSMFEYLQQNNLVLTYPDKEGNEQILKITEKK